MTTIKSMDNPPNYRLIKCCYNCKHDVMNGGHYCELYPEKEHEWCAVCDDWMKEIKHDNDNKYLEPN